MHYNIVCSYVPRLIIKHGFAERFLMSGFLFLLVPVLPLLVQYVLAPTLSVRWLEYC